MNIKKLNKEKISKYILIGFWLWMVILLLKGFFIDRARLREKGRYTIGYVYDYGRRLKKSNEAYYQYKVGNELRYSFVTSNEPKKYLHKRFLVQYLEEEENMSEMFLQYPIPDSIKEAPPEGWEKMPEWAKDKIKWFNIK